MEIVSDKGVAAGVAADSISVCGRGVDVSAGSKPGVIPARESSCGGIGSLSVNTPATARVPNAITMTAAVAPTRIFFHGLLFAGWSKIWRMATSPVLVMKNCSRPGVPLKPRAGQKESLML